MKHKSVEKWPFQTKITFPPFTNLKKKKKLLNLNLNSLNIKFYDLLKFYFIKVIL